MKRYFHGEHKTGPYFEGWYFKCQTLDGRSLALIPAFHISEHGEQSASMQVITGDRAWHLEYPASAFSASGDVLHSEIGGNCCSKEGLLLNVERRGLSLHGRLRFTGCICAIVLNGHEYRLAAYRGVKIQSWSAKDATLRQRKHRLEVSHLGYCKR